MSIRTPEVPAPDPTDEDPKSNKRSLLERILMGKRGMPRPELTDPREESKEMRKAIKGIWRSTFVLVLYSLVCAVPLSTLGALLRYPGADVALSMWWSKVSTGHPSSGLNPPAVAAGFVAIVVTLFVAHTMQGSDAAFWGQIDGESEMAARARAIVLDQLVYVVGLAGAVTGWLLIQLPADDADSRSVNFFVPLGSILVCSALAALTSRSAESNRLARITAEEQVNNLRRASEAYRIYLETAAAGGAIISDSRVTIQQYLTTWRHVFPWAYVVYCCLGWSLLWSVVSLLGGGSTSLTAAVLLGFGVLALVLTVAIVESVVEGIISRAASGRGGLLTLATVTPILPVILILMAGAAVLTAAPLAGLALLTFGLLPPTVAVVVFRTCAFRPWVAVELKWRLTAMERWLRRTHARADSELKGRSN